MMVDKTMKTILINKHDTRYRANLLEANESQLPESEVTLQVDWSALNFKDSLAIIGASAVVRRLLIMPGIDLAETVKVSSYPRSKPKYRRREVWNRLVADFDLQTIEMMPSDIPLSDVNLSCIDCKITGRVVVDVNH